MRYISINENDFSTILNIAKALAIIGIIFFHFFVDLGKLPNYSDEITSLLTLPSKVGSQGVLFFFFASGYGLMFSMIRRNTKSDLSFSFLKKRVSKLYPAYLLSIVFVLSIYLIFNIHNDRISLIGILSDLLLVRNFFEATIHGLNGNWWFVATIAQLYLIFMIFSLWFSKVSWYKIIATGFMIDFIYKIVLISLNAYGIVSIDAGDLNPYTAFFLNYISCFFLGIGIAKYIASNPIKIPYKYFLVYLFIIIPLGEYLGYILSASLSGKILNDLFFTVTYIPFLLMTGLLITKLSSQKLITLFLFISLISYEMYLIHHPLIKLTLHFLPAENSLIILSTGFFLIIIMATFIQKLTKVLK